MTLDYRTGRILEDILSTSKDSGPVVINKGNSRMQPFEIHKSIEKTNPGYKLKLKETRQI